MGMEVQRMEADRYCEQACRIAEFSRWKNAASSLIMEKICEDLSRKQDAYKAEHMGTSVRPLGNEPVYLKGDVTILDPFGTFLGNHVQFMEVLQQVLQDFQKKGHWEFVVLYKGQVAYFISSESWDEDAAFEVSRNGKSLYVDELPSKFIAVVTKQMVDIVLEEIGPDVRLEGGVCVQGVDGQLIHCGDGDFVISGAGVAPPVRKVSRWIEDECVRNADILCAAGGKWTFCDDSSDEDDE